MDSVTDLLLARLTLALHLAWIVWVIFGCLVTRGRPFWRGLHLMSLVYSMVIETAPWPCPLTLIEQWLQERAGYASYRGDFLIHFLETAIYPDVSPRMLMLCAVAVCAVNLGVYGWRFRHRSVSGW